MTEHNVNEKIDVFISFASQEGALASAMKSFVEAAFECDVFVSDTIITAGEIWQEEIVTSLRDAKLVLVLCSPFSISRQWVNFECGAAHLSDKKVLYLCHSGLTKAQLPQKHESHPWLLNREKAIDIHNAFFNNNEKKKNGNGLVNKIKEVLPDITAKDDFNSVEYKKNIDDGIRKVVERLRKQTNTKKEFLKFKLTKQNNILGMQACEEINDAKINKKIDTVEWIKEVNGKVAEMKLFLRGDIEDIEDVGVAIGIQNCLFDGKDIYVGVRMKAIGDANATTVGVAMGSYNTGYQLMKSLEKDSLKFESESTLQDLFVSKKEIKRSVYREQKIIDLMESRLEAFGAKLWRINFNNEQAQPSIATIFINNSRWFPRFEIGVWKFIDLSKLDDKDKAELKNNILAGFGEDIFLDYRGQEDVEGMNVSPWIWAKNGKIYYWSYPEERYIPRYKPTEYSEPKNAVLVTAKSMSEIYGNQRKYTPFASTEDLTDDNVIEGQFSLPARALLSCF